jgi:hypothetical protein
MGTMIKYYSEKHKIIMGVSPRSGNNSVAVFLRSKIDDVEKDVLYKTELVGNPEYLSICMLRNPYDRVISSYIWAARHIKSFKCENLSFKQFLIKIEESNLNSVDFHYGTQIDNLKYDYYFKMEHEFIEPQKIIKEKRNIILELPKRIRETRKYNEGKKVYDIPCKNLLKDGFLPEYSLYYDDEGEIKDLVTKIYKKDIELYDKI